MFCVQQQENVPYFKAALELEEIIVIDAGTVTDQSKKKADLAVPGKPAFQLE